MKCPIDNIDLVMTERSGIEIDYCPQCRGVWLDRGELDKIIERGNQTAQAPPPASGFSTPDRDLRDFRDDRDDRKRYDDDDDYKRHRQGQKKKGLFDDLFDF